MMFGELFAENLQAARGMTAVEGKHQVAGTGKRRVRDEGGEYGRSCPRLLSCCTVGNTVWETSRAAICRMTTRLQKEAGRVIFAGSLLKLVKLV